MNPTLLLAIPMLPLIAALLAGLAGQQIGRQGAALVTIGAVGASCLLSLWVLKQLLIDHVPNYEGTVYTWLISDGVHMQVGFLIDRLTALMMVVVTFVSLCVHVYTVGYMDDDPGYQRFFAYISLFTFSMLMLVMANNFMQLFFGWEAVGVVSYLLIGFWYTRPTAIFASLKAFLVNRVGDFGFVLGIAGVLYYTGSLDYRDAFAVAPAIAGKTMILFQGHPWSALTVICICLFVGAMGKSAQVPLHVWLPDSMEGPTPISALIHAATMVTAGIFMVARMSPLFELSETALSVVLIIGATTAFFMGLIGIVSNDIKRVIAYSTLSQLGYMTVALGASAYSAGIFHLMTHAFFKALLFLAAGSVIMAMHHEQDMRKMGGLRKYMPITWITTLIGSLALCGIPPFAGFFSKDAIIDAVSLSKLPGHSFAHFAVVCAAFVTAFYSFRMLFLAFHGRERFDLSPQADHDAHHDARAGADEPHDVQQAHGGPPHESPWVITLPLILLAIPSVYAGWAYIEPMLFGTWFGHSIVVSPQHAAMAGVKDEWHGVGAFIVHGLGGAPFWLALAGIAAAFYCYVVNPALPDRLRRMAGPIYTLLVNKYYFDRFNDWFFAGGARMVGRFASNIGDHRIIDGFFVNGSAHAVRWMSALLRQVQSGYVYHYAFTMIIGVFALLTWWVVR